MRLKGHDLGGGGQEGVITDIVRAGLYITGKDLSVLMGTILLGLKNHNLGYITYTITLFHEPSRVDVLQRKIVLMQMIHHKT